MRRPLSRRRPRSRGFALVAVLWLGVALGIAASSFLNQTRAESYRLRGEVETSHAVELARSGLNLALAQLAIRQSALPLDGTVIAHPLPGGVVEYRIWDEKGKADLNRSNARIVAAALESLALPGLDALDYAGLADRLLASAKRARDAAQAVTLSDVLRRADAPAALRARAGEVLTLHSFGARINPRSAQAGLLSAIPGLGEAGVAAILDAKRTGDTLPNLGAAEGWVTRSKGPVYRLTSTGRTEGGVAARMEALIISDGRGFRTGRLRFRVLAARIHR
ncbi:MAG: hypothetical protein AAGC57_19405 [Pseudomonadota bacterium]